MADLMSGVYTYSALKSKYENFTVPAAKVKIEGTDILGGASFFLSELEVCLCLEGAGSVRVKISHCYDEEQSSFDSKLKKAAVLGNKLELELGYGSSTTKVFKGFIAEVGADIDAEEGFYYEIVALDVRRLMMSESSHYLLHQVKNYSEAFETVMKPYKKLCTLSVDATNDKLEEPISQTVSDYDFITKELIGKCRADREFFVLADKAYFRKPRSNKTPILKLGIGEGLRTFSRSAGYLNQKIQVLGYDPTGENEISGEAEAKAADKQSAALAQAGDWIITDSGIHTKGKAQEKAKILAERMKNKSQKANISCTGLPEIVPGRFVEIKSLDDTMNKKYYVTKVSHVWDDTGFFTSFEMEGVAVMAETEYGLAAGTVKENWDDKHAGMVKVEYAVGEKGKNVTGWIPVLTPYAGNEFGSYFLPEIGSLVVIGYLGGNREYPVVLGNLNNQKNKLMKDTANQDNSVKALKTKAGNKITFKEEKGKEKIELETPAGLKLVLDDEKQTITAGDKDGKNKLVLDAKAGEIVLEADKKISLKAGGKAVTVLEASKANIKTDNITLDGSQLNLKGQALKAEGSNVEIKAQASLKAEASGVAQIKGSMLKLN